MQGHVGSRRCANDRGVLYEYLKWVLSCFDQWFDVMMSALHHGTLATHGTTLLLGSEGPHNLQL
jgi:hypothetical protein